MKKSVLIAAILCAFFGLGCELAGPLLIGEATKGDDPGGSTSAALTVSVDSAEGTVAGRNLAPEMFEATGDRVGQEVQIQLRTAGDLELWMTTQTDTSSTNPYGGGDFGGDFGDGSRGGAVPVPPPEGGSDNAPTEPFAELNVCESGVCRPADDFGIEIVQTESGRDAIVDGVWGEEEAIHVSLHYTEAR